VFKNSIDKSEFKLGRFIKLKITIIEFRITCKFFKKVFYTNLTLIYCIQNKFAKFL
jgi:hypothetical protein